jgi:hypothetical protein
LHADRDACKGSTDTPKGATSEMMMTTPKLGNHAIKLNCDNRIIVCGQAALVTNATDSDIRSVKEIKEKLDELYQRQIDEGRIVEETMGKINALEWVLCRRTNI